MDNNLTDTRVSSKARWESSHRILHTMSTGPDTLVCRRPTSIVIASVGRREVGAV